MRALVFLVTAMLSFILLSEEAIAQTPSPFTYDLPEVPRPGSKNPKKPDEATEDSKPEDESEGTEGDQPAKEEPKVCTSASKPQSLECRRALFLGEKLPLVYWLKSQPRRLYGTWEVLTVVTSEGVINPDPIPIGILNWQADRVENEDRTLTHLPLDGQPFRFYDESTVELYLADENGIPQGLQCRQAMTRKGIEMICKWYSYNDAGEFIPKGWITYHRPHRNR